MLNGRRNAIQVKWRNDILPACYARPLELDLRCNVTCLALLCDTDDRLAIAIKDLGGGDYGVAFLTRRTDRTAVVEEEDDVFDVWDAVETGRDERPLLWTLLKSRTVRRHTWGSAVVKKGPLALLRFAKLGEARRSRSAQRRRMWGLAVASGTCDLQVIVGDAVILMVRFDVWCVEICKIEGFVKREEL
jgi:hypothetical protein